MSKSNTFLGAQRISEILKGKPRRIHFVGIGGVGMYSLARLAYELGFTVTGSDRSNSEYIEQLKSLGINIKIPTNPEGVMSAALLVYSLAATENDADISYAEALGIVSVSRADFLSYISMSYKTKIAVSGAHGKSTVTAMLSAVFDKAGLNPTTALGASFSGGSPTRVGGRELFLYEACEYKNSFLCQRPDILLINNVELDHVDFFENTDALISSFKVACERAGRVIINSDGENAQKLMSKLGTGGIVTVGSGYGVDYRYTLESFNGAFITLTLRGRGDFVRVPLKVPGKHNAENAAMAVACALEMGIEGKIIEAALSEYNGIARRLEFMGRVSNYDVYYDYAHHPSEISAAISTLRLLSDDELTVVFKPHTYSRTAYFFDDFVRALSLADRVLLCDIYPAREEPIENITAERLASAVGDGAIYCEGDDVFPYLNGGGILAVLGAGNYSEDFKSRLFINNS